MKHKKNVAFAEVYLFQSLKNNTFDIEVYKQLMALDSKLGATAAEQLLGCMFYTLRLDIIKVRIHLCIEEIKIMVTEMLMTKSLCW